MVFRLWANDDYAYSGIWILPPLIKKKSVVKVGPPLTKLSGSAHAVLCELCYKGSILQKNYRKMTISWSFS